jgi:pyruvate dehydrogenase E2 component (dihydrolipoamide acetyltransferase)
MEMTALSAGTLLKILKGAGESAALGETIAIIGQPGEDISALLAEAGDSNGKKLEASPSSGGKGEPPASADGQKDTPKDNATKEADAEQKTAEETQSQSDKEAAAALARAESEPPALAGGQKAATKSNGNVSTRMLVSPIAARMAAENSIDLKSISGTGPNGRIIKRDVEEALAGDTHKSKAEDRKPFTASTQVGTSAYRDEPTSRMRQVIASRLAESIGPIPTFYLTVEIEMDSALALRKQVNATVSEDQKISVNDIVVKAAAMALVKHPFANSSYQDKSIRFYEQADIGVAVAVDEGLITPVIRGANLKGFLEISAEIKDLAGKAKAKKLQPEEYTGATFSISNLGMFGIKEFTAIINPPEAGIFAVGGATEMPVVRDGEITIRSIMNVTMSCDHRVIDGATGAKFLQTFKQMLESPGMMSI